MTREEIIDELCRLRSDIVNAGGYVNRTDVQKNRFVQALSEEIFRLQTEPCEDTISRQAVLECLDWYEHDRCEIDIYFREIVEDIKKLPSVQPEQKTWKWEYLCYQNMKCSRCGYVIAEEDSVEFRFCPNCGAKMKEGE